MTDRFNTYTQDYLNPNGAIFDIPEREPWDKGYKISCFGMHFCVESKNHDKTKAHEMN